MYSVVTFVFNKCHYYNYVCKCHGHLPINFLIVISYEYFKQQSQIIPHFTSVELMPWKKYQSQKLSA